MLHGKLILTSLGVQTAESQNMFTLLLNNLYISKVCLFVFRGGTRLLHTAEPHDCHITMFVCSDVRIVCKTSRQAVLDHGYNTTCKK